MRRIIAGSAIAAGLTVIGFGGTAGATEAPAEVEAPEVVDETDPNMPGHCPVTTDFEQTQSGWVGRWPGDGTASPHAEVPEIYRVTRVCVYDGNTAEFYDVEATRTPVIAHSSERIVVDFSLFKGLAETPPVIPPVIPPEIECPATAEQPIIVGDGKVTIFYDGDYRATSYAFQPGTFPTADFDFTATYPQARHATGDFNGCGTITVPPCGQVDVTTREFPAPETLTIDHVREFNHLMLGSRLLGTPEECVPEIIPPVVVEPEPCHEGDPCWDCETMGNRVCGPVEIDEPTDGPRTSLPETGARDVVLGICLGGGALLVGAGIALRLWVRRRLALG